MHPGPIGLFECASTNSGKLLLATAGHGAQKILLWDIYARGCAKTNASAADTPDKNLKLPMGHNVENMRWSNTSHHLFVTSVANDKPSKSSLHVFDTTCLQQLEKDKSSLSSEEGGRTSKSRKINKMSIMPSASHQLKVKASYIAFDNQNANIIFATDQSRKYTIDFRNERTAHEFCNVDAESTSTPNEECLVEYNQANCLVFANRLQKSVLVYDVRKVN